MKTIERYIVGSFLTAFFLCWLVMTFVLSIGLLVKVTSLISKGMPVDVVGRYFLTGIPETIGRRPLNVGGFDFKYHEVVFMKKETF